MRRNKKRQGRRHARDAWWRPRQSAAAALAREDGPNERPQEDEATPAATRAGASPEKTARAAGAASPFGDDALGVCFSRRGAPPGLARARGVELRARLARLRRRYRRAVLLGWPVLARAAEAFGEVQTGRLALDDVVDLVPSEGLTAEA